MVMTSDYSVIGFYVILMVLLTLVSVGYGEAILTSSDFKKENINFASNNTSSIIESGDVFGTLNFMLLVDVPESSKYANAIYVYRTLYFVIVIPYTILIGYMLLKLLRGN